MTTSKIWRTIPQYYNLIGNKCQDCNSLYFPKREVCLKCGNFEMEDFKFEGDGKIITFTIIRNASRDPQKQPVDRAARAVPYVLAIIELEEGPMLTAEIVDCDLDEIGIGKKVELVFRKIREIGDRGIIQYGYKFKIENG